MINEKGLYLKTALKCPDVVILMFAEGQVYCQDYYGDYLPFSGDDSTHWGIVTIRYKHAPRIAKR